MIDIILKTGLGSCVPSHVRVLCHYNKPTFKIMGLTPTQTNPYISATIQCTLKTNLHYYRLIVQVAN